MRRSVSTARPLIVLALVTILFTNSIAFSAYAGGRPAPATPPLMPTLSPTPLPGTNGRIAYVVEPNQSLSEIYSMNPDGSDPVRLTNNTVADYTPVYSPDGAQIAFVSQRNSNEDIYLMNADGSNEVSLTTDAAQDNSLAWSADGTKLAFVSTRTGNDQIFTMNADGSNQVQLTFVGVNRYPAWSPDGTTIAFISFRLGVDSFEVFTMNADGSNPVAITHNSVAESEPGWSPAGDNIVFTRAVGNPNAPNYEIFVINPDGSNEIQLTDNNPRQDVNPTWSPDATKIAFSSNRDNVFGHDVFVMDANGGNLTNITVGNGARGFAPSWGTAPTPTPQADLAATADAQPYQVEPGGALVFNNAVTNNGPSQASGVNVDVYVPPYTTLNSYDAPGGTCQTTTYPNDAGHQVLCSFDDLDVSETNTVTVHVTITAIDGASMQAITTVSSSTPDPVSGNNVAYAPLIVRAATPPAANLVASSGLDLLAANGATVTHNVSTFNYGPDEAVYVTFTIQLPPGATCDTATNPYGSCTARAPDAQGTLVDCTVGDIPVNESRLISHTAIVTGAPYDVLTFTSTVNSDTSDPYPDSNVSSVSVQIEGPPVPTPTPATGDNRLIAFEIRRDGNSEIYSRRADGSAQLNLTNDLADDADFVWSPDGSKLAFSRLVDAGSNNRELFVMNADGSNLLRLTNSPDDQDSGAVWSPDGTKLLFTSQSNMSNTRALWVTNADGSNQIGIGIAAYDYDNDPAWSPDGTKIAYARDYYDGMNPTERNIYTANADGSNRIRIANGPGESDFTPAWSADGTKINFVREVGGVVDVYDMDVDGSNQRNLSNIGTVYGYPAPSRSRDRSRIAFVTGTTGNLDMHVMNVDGSSGVNVFHTADNVATHSWSPDGTPSRSADRSKIAFVSGITNTPTVYVMNADGSSRVSVFNTSYYVATLGWSPDASKLVVGTIFNVGQGAGIHVVNADGSGSLHFGGDAEYNQDPDWSPDGTLIAFTTRRTGNGGIDIINADGTGRVDLTNDPAYYNHPKWQPVAQGNTPAGTNVAVSENGATVTFSNVTQAGQTTITPIDPNSLSGIPGEYVINANSLAFEITTTAVYTGPITIGFQVPGVNNPITFSTLRVLHGEPPPVPNFVDRTILAPDSPTHDFPARTIYARVTSLSPFVIAEKPPNQMTALGPAQIWVGLKNSDDVGTRFDLRAEVFKNGTLIGSGQVNNVAGGSSGFNNAKLNAINLALSGTPSFGAGSALSIRLSVRVTASGGHRSGTARLWFNDAAANSRFSATIGGVTKNYYLRKLNNSLVLTNTTAATPKVTIDVFVDRAVGGNPFKPFGTWAITF